MSRKHLQLSIIVSLVFALTFIIVPTAYVAEMITGEHVRIDKDASDDVYVAAATITVDATIDGDLIALGSILTINGTVTGDVLFFGQALILNGTVGDDVRLVGMTVVIDDGGEVGDDLSTASLSLEMKPGSYVGGDVLFGAMQALLGDVAGDVNGGSGYAVRFTGKIGGDANLTVGGGVPVDPSRYADPEVPAMPSLPEGLTFERDGRTVGRLRYSAPEETALSPDEVSGPITFTPLESTDSEVEIGFIPPLLQRFFRGFFTGTGTSPLGWVLSNFILLLIAGLLSLRFAPNFTRDTLENLRTRPGTSFGMGLLGYLGYWLVVLPLVVLLFLALVVPLALIGAGGRLFDVLVLIGFSTTVGFRVFARWLARVAVGLVFGKWIHGQIRKEARSSFWPLSIGPALTTQSSQRQNCHQRTDSSSAISDCNSFCASSAAPESSFSSSAIRVRFRLRQRQLAPTNQASPLSSNETIEMMISAAFSTIPSLTRSDSVGVGTGVGVGSSVGTAVGSGVSVGTTGVAVGDGAITATV